MMGMYIHYPSIDASNDFLWVVTGFLLCESLWFILKPVFRNHYIDYCLHSDEKKANRYNEFRQTNRKIQEIKQEILEREEKDDLSNFFYDTNAEISFRLLSEEKQKMLMDKINSYESVMEEIYNDNLNYCVDILKTNDTKKDGE